MKKLNFLFALMLVASLPFITSCGTDEEPTPPSLMLNAAPGYTSSDVTVPAGTVIKIGIIAKATSASLSNFKITQTVNNSSSTMYDTTFSVQSYNEDFDITTASVAGTVKLTFKVTAADGEIAEASVTITTTSTPINTYTAVLMGGQENPNMGSFYTTEIDSVMKLAAARQNQGKIDLVYYYGATNKASIVAVSDAQLADVPAFSECSTWTTRNATKFKLTSGIDWSTITDESGITANATDLTVTHINQLKVNDIVAFETAATSSNPSKKGLYIVKAISGSAGADRSITIEVKIQK